MKKKISKNTYINKNDYLCKRKNNIKLKIMLGCLFQVICLNTNCIYVYAKEREYDFLIKDRHMFDPINVYFNHILYQIMKLGILVLAICFLIVVIKKYFRRY